MDVEQIYKTLLGGSLILIGTFLVIGLIILVLYVVGLVKLFNKAGKPGWAAIIPFYNTYVLVEIAGLNWWYFLIAISGSIFSFLGISGFSTITWLASAAANFFIFYNLGKKFKQDPTVFGILGIFFKLIMVMILGFSNTMAYDSGINVSPNGPIENK